jgi:hypothetical protein
MQVTISYIDQMDTTAVRQRQLEKCYYFTCHCEACQDTEIVSNLLNTFDINSENGTQSRLV